MNICKQCFHCYHRTYIEIDGVREFVSYNDGIYYDNYCRVLSTINPITGNEIYSDVTCAEKNDDGNCSDFNKVSPIPSIILGIIAIVIAIAWVSFIRQF